MALDLDTLAQEIHRVFKALFSEDFEHARAFKFGKSFRLVLRWNRWPFVYRLDKYASERSQIYWATQHALCHGKVFALYKETKWWPKWMKESAEIGFAASVIYRMIGREEAEWFLWSGLPDKEERNMWRLMFATQSNHGLYHVGALALMRGVPDLGAKKFFSADGIELIEKHLDLSIESEDNEFWWNTCVRVVDRLEELLGETLDGRSSRDQG